MIEIKKVSKRFNTKNGELLAVDNVDLSIQTGEIFGIIGYSGAGKSTLLRMLNGLEKPTEGTISVSDKLINTIKGTKLRKARQEIGMIFQHFNLLWSRTVEDNIAFPLEIAGVPKSQRDQRVQELIELVGLSGRGKSYPSQLSGGQKQRVGIARALANNPKVLLCDEATSALDPETTDSILDLLLNINKQLGLTVVLITHEMHVIKKICHRVAVMENGKVAELGDVIDVFENPQQEVTKRFVKQVADVEDDSLETFTHLKEKYPEGHIWKLTFKRSIVEQPVLTDFIRKFDVTANIVQGNVSQTKNGAFGELFLHVSGTGPVLKEALTYLQEKGVQVEVMSDVN